MLAGVVTLVVLGASVSCSSPSAGPRAGPAEGLGDLYYPTDGNPGYDVTAYDITTSYDPASSVFTSTADVTAKATAHRRTFDLDLEPAMTVTRVTVDGAPATFSRLLPHELVIRPAVGLTAGSSLRVTVDYHGAVTESSAISGWHRLSGGGGVMAGEPHSCAYWYPCNDYPTDKATFRLTATVPARFTVVSNGLEGPTTSDGSGADETSTYRWNLATPTATYLTTILIDQLTVRRSRLPGGTPVVDAFSPDARGEEANEAKLPSILAFLASKFGPYPAPAAGGLFVDAPVGFSLETFTRPVYTAQVDFSTIVHENAHQWWGDNVSVASWKDVCFNECMASYAQWLWQEHTGLNLDDYYRHSVNTVDFDAPLYDMGAGNEFDYAGVYQKGAYFEHALRRKIGNDETYFGALQGIQRDFAGGNMSMIQFRDELSRRTGVDLTSFWREWVLTTGRPSVANLFPGTLAG